MPDSNDKPDTPQTPPEFLAEAEADAGVPQTADAYAAGIEHVYVSPKAPRFKTSIIVYDDFQEKRVKKSIQFDNGQLVLESDLARAFDEQAMATHAVKQYVSKVSKDKGLEIVRAHQRMMQTGVRGSADTSQLARLHGDQLTGSARALGEVAPNNPEALQEFKEQLAHGDMEVTEHVEHAAAETPEQTEKRTASKTSEQGGSLSLFGRGK